MRLLETILTIWARADAALQRGVSWFSRLFENETGWSKDLLFWALWLAYTAWAAWHQETMLLFTAAVDALAYQRVQRTQARAQAIPQGLSYFIVVRFLSLPLIALNVTAGIFQARWGVLAQLLRMILLHLPTIPGIPKEERQSAFSLSLKAATQES